MKRSASHYFVTTLYIQMKNLLTGSSDVQIQATSRTISDSIPMSSLLLNYGSDDTGQNQKTLHCLHTITVSKLKLLQVPG